MTKINNEQNMQGILMDILTEQRNEVLSMILSTFDKEVYERDLKEEAYDEGFNAGSYQKLMDLVDKKIAKGKTTEQIAEDLEEPAEVIQRIIDTL